MPFPKQDSRPFTKERIEKLKPGQMGCYGLFVANGGWVYVGKGDIGARLLAHFNGDNPCIIRYPPTHWYDVITNDYDAEEKRLIAELDPFCNRKIG